MTKPKFKRQLQEVTCDVCGNVFSQIRPWQAYCCTACRVKAWHLRRYNALNAADAEQRLRDEINRLRAILDDAGIPY